MIIDKRQLAEGEREMSGGAGVLDVAQYIRGEAEKLTTWKLHKLCYYAQAWSLVWDDEPLFNERIEAWANGPVIPALYRRFKGASNAPIGDPSRLNDEQRETVDAVLREYGGLSSKALIQLTHQEAPWSDARQREGLMAGERGSAEITLGSMAEYYALHGTVDPDEGLEISPDFKETLMRALDTPATELLTAEQMRSKLDG